MARRLRHKGHNLVSLPRELTAAVVLGYRGMDLLELLRLRHIDQGG